MLKLPRLSLVFWLSAITSIVALFIAVIAGELGNISVLVSVLALILACFFLYRGSISPRNKNTTFSSVTVLLGPVRFSFFVLFCLLGGFVSLLGLVDLILNLILKAHNSFLLSFFRLFIASLFY